MTIFTFDHFLKGILYLHSGFLCIVFTEVPLYKRAVPGGGSIYEEIARASGGSVVTTTKAGIGKVAQIIQVRF